jgi:hypothetical protein
MKLLVSMFFAVCLLTACNSESSKQAALLKAKQATVDSMKVVLAKQAVIDSMNAVMANNEEKIRQNVANDNAVTNSAITASTVSAASGIAASRVVSPNAPARYQTTAKRKKKWNNTAKGAVIGAGAGAITGAIVSKKRGKGAIIGGLIGGGAGAGTGLVVDHSKSRKN